MNGPVTPANVQGDLALVPATEATPEWVPRFYPGELISWKGVWFRLTAVTPAGIVLEIHEVDPAKLSKAAARKGRR